MAIVRVLWRGGWIAWALVAACRFESGATVGDGAADAAQPDDARRDAPRDAPRETSRDAPLDGPPCTPIADGSGRLTVPSVETPPTIDGDISEWTTCFVTLDAANAALVLDPGNENKFPSGRFALEHDAGHVYFAAQVTGIAPLGSATAPAIYKNNAIELYVTGNGPSMNMGYDADTLQIDIDHANREQAYSVGNAASTMDVTSVTTLGSDGVTYTIEASVEPGTFGLTAFGSSIGFDFAIDDGSGASQLSSLIWYEGCGANDCAGSACNQPFCDQREFGSAALAP
jgi:hypothetical protein